MSMWMVLLGVLVGCGSSNPEPSQAEAPTQAARGKLAKQKRKMKSRKAKQKAKRGASQLPPVGAAGEVLGQLVLTQLEEPARKPGPTAAPAAAGTEEADDLDADEGTATAAPAAAPDGTADATDAVTVTRTRAELKLSWANGGAQTVGLGKVRGTCSEGEPKPVGPPGKEKTPLWTVHCEDAGKTLDLFILQIGPRISVVREAPGATPEAPKIYKPVKRIPLVQGATLKRDS